MSSPLTCPDCGARRQFSGFENTKIGQNEIRIFCCEQCGLTEKLEIAGRQAVTVWRSRSAGSKSG